MIVRQSVGQFVLCLEQARTLLRWHQEQGVALSSGQLAKIQRLPDGSPRTTQLHGQLQRIDRAPLQAALGYPLEDVDIAPRSLQTGVGTGRVQTVEGQ